MTLTFDTHLTSLTHLSECLKAPISISYEIFYCKVSLPASHYSFVIVNDHDWPTLI